MTKYVKCEQKKCAFYIMGRGCRRCKDCGAEPYVLDDDCPTCWNCSRDEGLLRWDDFDMKEDEKQAEKDKKEEEKQIIEVKAK